MNFSVLPPEINSLRLFSDAGSTSMLEAAAAWGSLADELQVAASSFSSVTAGLASGAWQGPASAAMSAVAAPYASWLSAAAAQAAGTAGRASAAAAVFEAAQAAIVHPAMVAANRNELVALVISNLFGQNAPAIAATEAVYEQLWAQDVAVMAGYHAGVSAIAQQLAPWQQALALPAADADFSLSIFGLQLVKTGTANATTTFGGLAIASGANSSADAGVADIAFAFGSGSSASATGGVLNIAGVGGANSSASATGGINIGTGALAVGDGNTVNASSIGVANIGTVAAAFGNNSVTAIANGVENNATVAAAFGNNNTDVSAIVNGVEDTGVV